jgi:hypothetical protein
LPRRPVVAAEHGVVERGREDERLEVLGGECGEDADRSGCGGPGRSPKITKANLPSPPIAKHAIGEQPSPLRR